MFIESLFQIYLEKEAIILKLLENKLLFLIETIQYVNHYINFVTSFVCFIYCDVRG